MILIVDPRLLLLIPVGVSEPGTDAQVPVTRLQKRREDITCFHFGSFSACRSPQVKRPRSCSSASSRTVSRPRSCSSASSSTGQDRAVQVQASTMTEQIGKLVTIHSLQKDCSTAFNGLKGRIYGSSKDRWHVNVFLPDGGVRPLVLYIIMETLHVTLK